jgi:hypothetical protein
MVRTLSPARVRPSPSSLVLGERGAGTVLLPSLREPRESARAVGGGHEAAFASSGDRPVPSARPRGSLDSAVVTNPVRLRRERARRVVTMPDGKEKRPPVLGPSVQSTIDYLDQTVINYLDRSHQMRPGRSGGCPPELPQIRTCPIKASGSSYHVFATGRHTEWIAIAGGNGYRFRTRLSRSQGIRPPRRRRDSQRFQIHVAALRNRPSALELPVMP